MPDLRGMEERLRALVLDVIQHDAGPRSRVLHLHDAHQRLSEQATVFWSLSCRPDGYERPELARLELLHTILTCCRCLTDLDLIQADQPPNPKGG